MIIPLRRRLLAASSSLPGSRNESDRFCSLFGLASGGVYQAKRVAPPAGALLPHRFTLTEGGCRLSADNYQPERSHGPLFWLTAESRRPTAALGGLLSVALSLISRPVGVTHRPVLRRPDFPPVRPLRAKPATVQSSLTQTQ